MFRKLHFAIKLLILLLLSSSAQANERCVYVDELDPQHKIWFEGEVLAYEWHGEVKRFQDKVSGGTGVASTGYRSPDGEIITVLMIDLSRFTTPEAPKSVLIQGGNPFWPECH